MIANKVLNTVSPKKTFEQLLGNHPFLVIKNQLLFKKGKDYILTQILPDEDYTISDYNELPESAPFQLVKSKLVFMPSLYNVHQEVLGNLHILMGNHVKQTKQGIVRIAPLDVHFNENNIFQPDLLFIRQNRKSISTNL